MSSQRLHTKRAPAGGVAKKPRKQKAAKKPAVSTAASSLHPRERHRVALVGLAASTDAATANTAAADARAVVQAKSSALDMLKLEYEWRFMELDRNYQSNKEIESTVEPGNFVEVRTVPSFFDYYPRARYEVEKRKNAGNLAGAVKLLKCCRKVWRSL